LSSTIDLRAASSAAAWWRRRIRRGLGGVGVGERVFEESGQQLRAQYAQHRAIDVRFRHAPVLDHRDQRRVTVGIRQLHVDAGLQCLARRVRLVGRRRDAG
jgi:hypothetical protein